MKRIDSGIYPHGGGDLNKSKEFIPESERSELVRDLFLFGKSQEFLKAKSGLKKKFSMKMIPDLYKKIPGKNRELRFPEETGLVFPVFI